MGQQKGHAEKYRKYRNLSCKQEESGLSNQLVKADQGNRTDSQRKQVCSQNMVENAENVQIEFLIIIDIQTNQACKNHTDGGTDGGGKIAVMLRTEIAD